jgi:hypothetical protein
MTTDRHMPEAPPPAAQMLQLIIVGRQISHAIATAARLDLATQIGAGTVASDELARRTGAHPDALYRLMRALASIGVFAEEESGNFRNTPLSETLRADVQGSALPMALFFGHDFHVEAYLGLDHSVKTGEPGFEHVHGMPVWDFVVKHPDIGGIFNNAMTALSSAFGPAIAEAYDFTRFDRLIDVGGGHGQLLASILARHPGPHGVLFDLPHVVAGAKAVVESRGLTPRIDIVAGDFFESVPAAGAYIMKNVLHDWSDADATRILRTIHRAARPGARLFLAEAVLAPGNQADVAKFMDLEMLVATRGGRERSAAQWTTLLRTGGFELDRVHPTASSLALLEATRT